MLSWGPSDGDAGGLRPGTVEPSDPDGEGRRAILDEAGGLSGRRIRIATAPRRPLLPKKP